MARARGAIVVLACAWAGCAGFGRNRDLDEVRVHLDVQRLGVLPPHATWGQLAVSCSEPRDWRVAPPPAHLAAVVAFQAALRAALPRELPTDRDLPEASLGLHLDSEPLSVLDQRVEGGLSVVATLAGARYPMVVRVLAAPPGAPMAARSNAQRIKAALVGAVATIETVFLTDKSAPIARAIEHARAGELAEAKTLFEIASRNAPAHQDIAWFDLGQIAWAEDDHVRARECYTKAWRLVPDPRYQAALERSPATTPDPSLAPR